jgi:general secretion pathway protein I
VNARGFTLLEVLVALAILGTAVVAAIQGFAGGLRLLKLSGDHQHAMVLADQKIRELTIPVEGREDGTEDRFQWMRTVTRVPMPELEASPRGRRWGAFEIDVRVRWDATREVHLATLRTVPVDASGQPVQPGTSTQPLLPGQQPPPTPQATPGGSPTPAPTPTPPTGAPSLPGRLPPASGRR